jgi:mitotic spindle assembly checkpoint protein MAD2
LQRVRGGGEAWYRESERETDQLYRPRRAQEFFGYSINSILYQRGIYPPETFKRVSKYGLAILVTENEFLKSYLDSVLKQLEQWLLDGSVQKLVLVISGTESKQALERWVFNVEADRALMGGRGENAAPSANKTVASKPLKEITAEIQAIIRQITASVTFLPLLNEPCTFDLLVHTDTGADVPQQWEESDPRYITNATDVKLRSFTTKVHKVDACVSYRNADDDSV